MKYMLVFVYITLSGCQSVMQSELDRLHAEFHYVPDMEQYGVPEFWISSTSGDCEDFALLLQKRLGDYGIGSKVVIVRTEDGSLHAVLNVGDKIMDNRSPFPMTWAESGYERVTGLSQPPVMAEKMPKRQAFWGAYAQH